MTAAPTSATAGTERGSTGHRGRRRRPDLDRHRGRPDPAGSPGAGGMPSTITSGPGGRRRRRRRNQRRQRRRRRRATGSGTAAHRNSWRRRHHRLRGRGGRWATAVRGGRGGTTGSAGAVARAAAAARPDRRQRRSDGGSNPDGAAAPTFTDIYTTILVDYCAGISCHSPGTQGGVSFASQSSAYSAVSSARHARQRRRARASTAR